jgi:hypothetical protein
MKPSDLLAALIRTDRVTDVEQALEEFETIHAGQYDWSPIGMRRNNSGTIEVSANTGRALVERVTNGIDAVLESENRTRGGIPECHSPREAGHAWLGIPDDGLSAMSPRQRQQLANRVTVTMNAGEGPGHRCVEVADTGIGLTADEMPRTILSLNEENKTEKEYLAGRYGQGGSATLAASKYSLIYSRKPGSSTVAFTVIKYQEPPPDRVKGGHYVYLRLGERVLEAPVASETRPVGTTCKHFAYDLSTFGSPIGPNSVYGLLQQVLFDPVIPIWFDNRVHGWRRVIKGSRNALNGAVDEGDESGSGPKLAHHAKLFHSSLGEYGRLGIEYWVLPAPEKNNKRPTAAFVDPRRPIVLTLNGQNQGEMPVSLIRKDAELPYLAHRLICHLDCNAMTALALRGLLVSNREDARSGIVHDMMQKELIQALRSDDDLTRLNAEAKESTLKERDESATHTMRQEVARLLRLQGFEVSAAMGAVAAKGTAEDRPGRGKRSRGKPIPIELHEPPTFVRLIWSADEPITLYPGQRRYVRVETDAHSRHHDPTAPEKSRFNFVISGNGLRVAGTTTLQGGRMRVMVDCSDTSKPDDTGDLRVELSRAGQSLLSDSRKIAVIKRPEAKEAAQKIVMPQFRVVPVEPESPEWLRLGWPDDTAAIASDAERDEGVLVIYYSTAFPKYVQALKQLEKRDTTTAVSFTRRYEIWLAVHSLILDEDKSSHHGEAHVGIQEEQLEAIEQAERCRMAVVAAMVAAREIRLPESSDD